MIILKGKMKDGREATVEMTDLGITSPPDDPIRVCKSLFCINGGEPFMVEMHYDPRIACDVVDRQHNESIVLEDHGVDVDSLHTDVFAWRDHKQIPPRPGDSAVRAALAKIGRDIVALTRQRDDLLAANTRYQDEARAARRQVKQLERMLEWRGKAFDAFMTSVYETLALQNKPPVVIVDEDKALEIYNLRAALEPFATACRTNTIGSDPDDAILRVPMEVKALRRAYQALNPSLKEPSHG